MSSVTLRGYICHLFVRCSALIPDRGDGVRERFTRFITLAAVKKTISAARVIMNPAMAPMMSSTGTMNTAAKIIISAKASLP